MTRMGVRLRPMLVVGRPRRWRFGELCRVALACGAVEMLTCAIMYRLKSPCGVWMGNAAAGSTDRKPLKPKGGRANCDGHALFRTSDLLRCVVIWPVSRIGLTTAFYLTATVTTVLDIQRFGRRNGIDSIMQVLMGRGDTNDDDEDEEAWQADGFGGQASSGCT